MGDLEKTVKILFQGTDFVSDKLKTMGKNIDRFGDDLQDLGEPFASAAEKVAFLETAILAVAAAGLKARSDMEQEATKMANALGLPTEKAQEFEEIAKSVYTAGFGEDLSEAFNDVTLAAQKFSEESAEGIESIVTNGKKIQSTFGVDVSESLSGVKTLMDKFGLSSTEAFDFVVAGFQKGLNGSGDFIESINEYSTQFANGGADAGQFFSVLQTGYQEGVLGTDKAADAFKEFRVRIEDGSKTTAEALAQLGLGDEFTDSLSNGEITAIEAFNTVIQKLNEVDDSSVKMQAGVGLIGTQFEDLGTDAALALNTTATKMDDLQGKIDAMDPNDSIGKKFTSMMRTITTTITGADIWDGVDNELAGTFDRIRENFVGAWNSFTPADFQGMLDAFDGLFSSIGDGLDNAGIDLLSEEGIKAIIQDIIDTIESITDVSSGIVEVLSPMVGLFADLARAFNDLSPETKELAGNILGIGTALVTVGGAISAGGGLLSGLSTLTGLVSSGGALATGLAGLVAVLTGPAGIAVALGAAAAGVIAFDTAQRNAEQEKRLEEYKKQAEAIGKVTDQINALPANVSTVEIWAKVEAGDLEGAQKMVDELTKEAHEVQLKTDAEEQDLLDYWDALTKIPEEKKTELLALINEGDQQKVQAFLESIGQDKTISVGAKVDNKALTKTTETIEVWTEKHGTQTFTFEVDAKGVDKAKKKIDELPSEKILEIKAQGEIDKELELIKTSAENIQTAMEWTAKVDIAEIESATRQVESAFSSINTSITSTGDVISAALAGADSESYQARNASLDILRDEQDLREQSFELQKKLTEAQIEYMNARSKAAQSGDMAIQIESTGLEPSLEMILWEIIKKVQIRANEESADFLLGIS